MGFLTTERTALENEKKALQTHAEELINILTHWEAKKPEKKKKPLVLNKTQQKIKKPTR